MPLRRGKKPTPEQPPSAESEPATGAGPASGAQPATGSQPAATPPTTGLAFCGSDSGRADCRAAGMARPARPQTRDPHVGPRRRGRARACGRHRRRRARRRRQGRQRDQVRGQRTARPGHERRPGGIAGRRGRCRFAQRADRRAREPGLDDRFDLSAHRTARSRSPRTTSRTSVPRSRISRTRSRRPPRPRPTPPAQRKATPTTTDPSAIRPAGQPRIRPPFVGRRLTDFAGPGRSPPPSASCVSRRSSASRMS